MKSFATFGLAMFAVVAMGTLATAEVKIGDKAPDFTATSVDGKQVSLKKALSDSEAVVVCFTCNKCPVAVAYEDRFIDFTKKYKGKVSFIAVNCNAASEDLEQMKQRAEEKGFNFTYAYDESGDAARDYGARVTPELYVVNKQGTVEYHGAFDDNQKNPKENYLVSAVDSVLAGKKPEVTETKARGCGIKLKK